MALRLLRRPHTAGRHATTIYCNDAFAFPGIFLRGVPVTCPHCGAGSAIAVDDQDAPTLRQSALASREH